LAVHPSLINQGIFLSKDNQSGRKVFVVRGLEIAVERRGSKLLVVRERVAEKVSPDALKEDVGILVFLGGGSDFVRVHRGIDKDLEGHLGIRMIYNNNKKNIIMLFLSIKESPFAKEKIKTGRVRSNTRQTQREWGADQVERE